MLCILFSASPKAYILHNDSTIGKPKDRHWYKLCVQLHVLLSCVDSSNHSHNPDTELLCYHKALACTPWGAF